MTPEEVLALAQAGHPKVITAIMNRSTQVHNIAVRVALKNNRLHVLMEGAAIANPDLIVTFVQASFKKLKVNPEFTVQVYGRQQGTQSVSWTRTFEMEALNESSMNPIEQFHDPETASKDESRAIPSITESEAKSPVESASTAMDGDRPIDAPSADIPMPHTAVNPKFPMEPSPWDVPSPSNFQDDNVERSPMTTDEMLQATTSSMTDPTTNSADSPDPTFEPSPALAYDEPKPADPPEMYLSSETPSEISSGTELASETRISPEINVPEELERNEKDEDIDSINFQEIAKQPEALVLILFAIMLYIWQIYTALIDDVAPEGAVSGRELAERLGVNQSTISRRKLQDDFVDWTANLDPDGIAWGYDQGVFVPQIPNFAAQ